MTFEIRERVYIAVIAAIAGYVIGQPSTQAWADGTMAAPGASASSCHQWETRRAPTGKGERGWEPFASVVRGNSTMWRRCTLTSTDVAETVADRQEGMKRQREALAKANAKEKAAIAKAEAARKLLKDRAEVTLGDVDALDASRPVLLAWVGQTVTFTLKDASRVTGELTGIRSGTAFVLVNGKRQRVDLLNATKANRK